jgi:hypothetical protein
MYTFEHPNAPTVTYTCALPKAVASYATDHLDDFNVYVVGVEDSPYGIGIEVFDKVTSTQLGIVVVH